MGESVRAGSSAGACASSSVAAMRAAVSGAVTWCRFVAVSSALTSRPRKVMTLRIGGDGGPAAGCPTFIGPRDQRAGVPTSPAAPSGEGVRSSTSPNEPGSRPRYVISALTSRRARASSRATAASVPVSVLASTSPGPPPRHGSGGEPSARGVSSSSTPSGAAEQELSSRWRRPHVEHTVDASAWTLARTARRPTASTIGSST